MVAARPNAAGNAAIASPDRVTEPAVAPSVTGISTNGPNKIVYPPRAPTRPPTTIGSRIRVGSIRGARARRWRTTKPMPISGPNRTNVAASHFASGSPDTEDTTSRVTVELAASKIRPIQSKRPPGVRCRVRASRYRPATTPSTPTGTLIQNTHRQPRPARSRPPTTGPNANPNA